MRSYTMYKAFQTNTKIKIKMFRNLKPIYVVAVNLLFWIQLKKYLKKNK